MDDSAPRTRPQHEGMSDATQAEMFDPGSAAAPVRRYQCTLCDQSFTRDYDRKRHAEAHKNKPLMFRCPYCPRVSDSVFGVRYANNSHVIRIQSYNRMDNCFRHLKKHQMAEATQHPDASSEQSSRDVAENSAAK